MIARGSVPFDYESNGAPIGSELRENCNYDHIPFDWKRNSIHALMFATIHHKTLFSKHWNSVWLLNRRKLSIQTNKQHLLKSLTHLGVTIRKNTIKIYSNYIIT